METLESKIQEYISKKTFIKVGEKKNDIFLSFIKQNFHVNENETLRICNLWKNNYRLNFWMKPDGPFSDNKIIKSLFVTLSEVDGKIILVSSCEK